MSSTESNNQDLNASTEAILNETPNRSEETIESEDSNTQDSSMSITESENLDPRTLHGRGDMLNERGERHLETMTIPYCAEDQNEHHKLCIP